MKAAVIDRFGEPAEVLSVRETPAPAVGPGRVRIRMLAAPVNPSDLMVVRGAYGRLPALPATPGFEGVGVIEEAGAGLLAKLRGLRPGRRVAVIHGHGGTWAEQAVIPARHAVPVSAELPDEQVASFFVNPGTALVMTRWVLRVPAGAWLLQTAAASALGKMVIKLGRHFGFRTINLVRRPDHVEELRRLGGDEVIVVGAASVEERVQQLTGGAGVRYALDCVGGAMGREAVRALGPGGRLLIYGTLSGEPIALEPRRLMVGQKRIEGFWMSEWAAAQRALTMLRLFKQIDQLLRAGVLTTAVQATLPLDQVAEAARLAETQGRHGKVLLRIAPAQ
jgi:NADPH:quinone reductase-like Zn-dependent oxidoreductase